MPKKIVTNNINQVAHSCWVKDSDAGAEKYPGAVSGDLLQQASLDLDQDLLQQASLLVFMLISKHHLKQWMRIQIKGFKGHLRS